ncbi:MAG: DUF3313 domain-containing protein [Proteobacteria bacterium]|nr:DUF3313 domain-containing protein [Pseudomonadota bacterium]
MCRFKSASQFSVNKISLASIAVLALSACSGTEPTRYTELANTTYLEPNTGDDSAKMPYRYAAPVDWRGYTKAMLDPVEIYRGPDQQFGDLKEQDKEALAQYMQVQFSSRLATRFTPVTNSGLGTIRIHLTLTGAETNVPVLSTFTRFDLAGSIYNGVQAVRGGEGMMTGSVSYMVEIFDALTGQLLHAYVTKQYPGAYNLSATMGSLAAAEVGIEKGADTLLDQLN